MEEIEVLKLMQNMVVIFLILLLSDCGGQLKTDTKELRGNEIRALISELIMVTRDLDFLNEKMFSYGVEDPQREKIGKDYERLRKRHLKIIERLIKIGTPVIPHMREMIKDKNLSDNLKVDAVIVLGQVSKDREEREVILDLLAILPSNERESTIAIMGALFKIGKPAIPYIINQLGNEDPEKRVWAFELLKQMTLEKFPYYNPEEPDEGKRQAMLQMIKDWWDKNKHHWKMPVID